MSDGCDGCFWEEGGRCYVASSERDSAGISRVLAEGRCAHYGLDPREAQRRADKADRLAAERARFEARFPAEDLTRTQDGDYASDTTEWGWVVWLAALGLDP